MDLKRSKDVFVGLEESQCITTHAGKVDAELALGHLVEHAGDFDAFQLKFELPLLLRNGESLHFALLKEAHQGLEDGIALRARKELSLLLLTEILEGTQDPARLLDFSLVAMATTHADLALGRLLGSFLPTSLLLFLDCFINKLLARRELRK